MNKTGELFLRNGDYVPDGRGGFSVVSGGEELLQRVLLRLIARRGGCPFLPTFGSRLYLLSRAKPDERGNLARQYVTEALAEEEGLEVIEVTLEGVQQDRGTLTVDLNWKGENLALTVEV